LQTLGALLEIKGETGKQKYSINQKCSVLKALKVLGNLLLHRGGKIAPWNSALSPVVAVEAERVRKGRARSA